MLRRLVPEVYDRFSDDSLLFNPPAAYGFNPM